MIMMMMMMMMMIILLNSKTQIEIFYNLLTAPRTVYNMYAQVARAQSRATHRALIRATCPITCHVVRGDSSAIKFEFNSLFFSFLFSFILLTEPLKEGRKPEYQEKTPGDELQKMPHTKPRRFKPQARLEPAQWHWWQARKADALIITSRVAHTSPIPKASQGCTQSHTQAP